MNLNYYKDVHKQIWYFHYFLNNPSLLNEVSPDFFGSNLSPIFTIAKAFVIKYKKVPTVEELYNDIQLHHTNDEITQDYVVTVMNRNYISTLSEEYLADESLKWLKVCKLEDSIRKAAATYKSFSGDNIDELIESVSKSFTTDIKLKEETKHTFFDFFNIESHKNTLLYRFPTGYKFLDECLGGGYWKGSLITFLSGAKVGKSTWVTNLAVEGALKHLNVAIVSLELSKEMIMQRLACKALNLCMDEYTQLANNDKEKLATLLFEFKGNNYGIGEIAVLQMPTSRVTVKDIERELLNKEAILGKKFDVIFVDYFNLIMDVNKNDNSYTKIKNIVEALRGMGIANEWAIVSPTQTNRGAIRAEQIALENIGESINVAQTVDALFSIETSEAYRRNGKQRLRCMLTRVSNKQGFYQLYNVNFNNMTINEETGKPIDDENGTNEMLEKAMTTLGIKPAQNLTVGEVIATYGKQNKLI